MPRNVNTHGITDCVILAKGTSTSGKYFIFYGQHYVGGHLCYDVGCVNLWDKTITRRHYTGDEAKEMSMSVYTEFRDRMTEPAKDQETDEVDPKVYLN